MEKTKFNFIFRKRGDFGIFLLIPGILAVSLSRPFWKSGGASDFFMNAAGWIFLAAYISFRLWSTLYIGGLKDVKLQTEGPYSVCRNPLYFGSFCLALSAAFFLKTIIFLVLAVIVAALYALKVIPIEESYLSKKFGGDFNRYCRATPRFIPSFRRHHSQELIPVELRALQSEAKRLWASLLFPVVAVPVLIWLRESSWWPHFFRLP